ncbi:LOW QUALITY PROTEIN: alcohol dehydrogenase 1-like [Acomys russatus]|uniref:LOW QUALITY PROTEIN: alcohol dehydrogenase 1-like n=1 Tax=Acomys russatus TaxID=60746 RepID=UPI0021E27293|nr:LOW QUALITY PROTEIN: alcohol dehydrogenase 1-like [Acomys russatus]
MEHTSLSKETACNVITCWAAVAWTTNAPLPMEIIEVDPPKAGEVRIKIISSGICGTDNHILEEKNKVPLPAILGHEGAGIVESIGHGVTTVKPGDKVLVLPLPECRKCIYCLHPRGNVCEKENVLSPTGLMLDGTSRFTCKGKKIYHLYGTSTFTEYTVVDEISLAKIADDAPMDKVCVISCEVPTGFGAVFNTAQVTAGSTCLVLGLGGIGCAIVIACKASGASRIIGVDINEQKFPRARALGATECLNPNKLKKPVHEVVMEMTGIGVDFAFEAIGLIETMVTALKTCHVSYGVCVIMGVAPSDSQLSFDPMVLLPGRTLKSSIMGDYKTRDTIPKLVTDYMLKKINIDSLITHTLPFKKINEGFEVLRKGNCIRCVLLF